MAATVKAPTQIGIDRKVQTLRLQLVQNEMSRRIGARIRSRREELGLRQRHVAARMPSAVDPQRISDWERGYNKPSDRYLFELVQALDVPDVSYFMEGVGDESRDDEPAGTPDLAAVYTALEDQVTQLDRIEAGQDLSALTEQLDRIEGRLEDLSGRLPQDGASIITELGDTITQALAEGLRQLLAQEGLLPPPAREDDQRPGSPPAAASDR